MGRGGKVQMEIGSFDRLEGEMKRIKKFQSLESTTFVELRKRSETVNCQRTAKLKDIVLFLYL